LLLALGAFFALVIALAACGNSVPGNAVAKVGDASITKDTFNHWMTVASKSQQAQGGATAAATTIPQPPDFTACIAGKRKTLPAPPKGQKAPTDAQLKAQCKQEYEGLRDQVMQFLIFGQWIQGEAKDQGVKVTDADVQKQLAITKKQSFPKEKDFQKFLKDSGETMQDILFRVKLNTLSTKIREKVIKGKDPVTPAQISAYYTKNRARFAQPQRRDLLVVLTKTRAKAAQAKAAIQSGQSFAKVAKKFSIDQASKAQGGKLLGVAKGQSEKALDAAVFAASKNKLVGPVKTQFGYYVFKVTKVTAASQQTLAQATPTIKGLLASQNQQTAFNNFFKGYQKKWKGRTNCAKDFLNQNCKNAPKVKTTATAPATGTPQQAPPQQAPPQQAPSQTTPSSGGSGTTTP
jgi:foldase protein PrsA